MWISPGKKSPGTMWIYDSCSAIYVALEQADSGRAPGRGLKRFAEKRLVYVAEVDAGLRKHIERRLVSPAAVAYFRDKGELAEPEAAHRGP
jgi:hypothetical protein